MTKFVNQTNVPLSLAVWLAEDTYAHNSDPRYISATGLLKSVKQIILSKRVGKSEAYTDISANIASRMGTAFHDSIEGAWVNNYKQSLEELGYPKGMIDRVIINPYPEDLTDDCIPIYTEHRSERVLEGWTISGESDFIMNGRVEDFKSTGVFSYMSGSNDEKYRMQGSIYRWLKPTLITDDIMAIQFIFTDWSKLRASIEKDKGYPQSKLLEKTYELIPMMDVERFIKTKLRLIETHIEAPEEDMPMCTQEELWQKDPSWKYYKDPSKRSRSTKNFTNSHDAQMRLINDGGTGIVIEVPGEIVGCKYCNAFSVCKQKDAYVANGSLKL